MTTTPPTLPARVHTTQQVHYHRFAVNFNDVNISAPTNPSGRLPLGAIIHDISVDIETAFNAGTTNVLTIGTTTASANEIVAAADVNEGATGYTRVSTGLGGSLCRSAEQNIYAKYTQSGTAATAGKAHVCIQYTPLGL